MISPTLAAQAGDGRHKLAAAASPNSLLVSLVSVPGQASNQADDTLSLCFHAHAALVLLGLTRERALVNTFALVHSIASTTLPRVLPDVDPSPEFIGLPRITVLCLVVSSESERSALANSTTWWAP